MKETTWNIIKHWVQIKRLQPFVIAVYDLTTMIVETEDQSKLKKIKN